ncbi:hypothetical protein AB0M29_31935 [Streptomyces sp. NPDC051976]|uniref:hypothetical protein n=1 Tax=Streptomyces sp. NPDC051976 TaxID=3154947 RepID=UPI00341870D8
MTENVRPTDPDESEPEVEAHAAPVLGLQGLGVSNPQPEQEAWGSSYSWICTPHPL